MATKKATSEAKKAGTVNTSSAKTETIKTETQQKAAKAEPAKTSTTEKAAKTTTAKKTAAKRTSAKKDIKVKAIVEYYGKQVEEKDMIANVKKAWTKSGRKVGEINGRLQFMVGLCHLQFILKICDRPQTSNHHPGFHFSGKFHQ